MYREIYKVMNCGNEPLRIPQMSNTHWISIEPAVSHILNQYNELKLHFDLSKQKEKCYTAQMLSAMYNDPQNLLYLSYLKPILVEIQKTVGRKY